LFCEICGRPNAQKHHIFTRGAHGKRAETPENIVNLCWPHHMAWHDVGRETAAVMYGFQERVRCAEEAVRGICSEHP